jgi:hypothetical protein
VFIELETNGKSHRTNLKRSMKRIFQNLSNRMAAIALGGAVVLAGSALAFTQKPKAENVNLPPVDERPIARDANGIRALRRL